MAGLRQKIGKTLPRGEKWSAKKQALFFKDLAGMLKAGFSIHQAVINLKRAQVKPDEDLIELDEKLQRGISLSQALKKHLQAATYYQLVIAELHGSIEESIEQLGMYLERKNTQKNKLLGLLIYPLFLLVFLFGIVVFMKIFLEPQLRQFEGATYESGVDIRQLGQIMALAILLVLSIYLGKVYCWWRKQKALNRHYWYCSLPLIGRIYQQYCRYYLSFNLAMLLNSGLDLKDICRLLLNFEKKSLFYQIGYELNRQLNQGQDLGAMEQTLIFMPELKHFFELGQTKTEISAQLMLYAKLSYHKLVRQIDNLLALVQPLCFLVIALVIIGSYLSMLLPLYNSLGEMK